jgi:hypothetical protein
MPHIQPHIDPTDLIIDLTKRSNTELGRKLAQVYQDVFNEDELDFLIAAIGEIQEIFPTVPPETTIAQVIDIWANRRLKELD